MKLSIQFVALTTILLVVFTHSSATARMSTVSAECGQSNLKIEMLKDVDLDIVSAKFSDSADEDGITLRNRTQHTIVSVAIVVAYADSNETPIFSVPYFGSVDGNDQPVYLRPFIRTLLPRPVRPNETFTLFGTNLISTRVPPANGHVTYVNVKYNDGNGGFTDASPSTEPLLLKVPEYFRLGNDLEQLPDELIARLSIDARGRTQAVSFMRSSLANDIAEKIRSELLLWLFFPATQDWSAVPSHLVLRIRFHEKAVPLPAPVCPLDLPDSSPRTFVEVDIQRVEGLRWTVMYAGWTASGNLNTKVSTTGLRWNKDRP